MKGLAVVAALMAAGAAVLVFGLRPGGVQETASASASASAELDPWSQPLVWTGRIPGSPQSSMLAGPYYICATTAPGTLAQLRSEPDEPVPETLGEARERLVRHRLADLAPAGTWPLADLVSAADLMDLKRDVQQMRLWPYDLHRIVGLEPDAELRTVALLALGFSTASGQARPEVRGEWLCLAAELEQPDLAGAARFAAYRGHRALCADIRDELLAQSSSDSASADADLADALFDAASAAPSDDREQAVAAARLRFSVDPRPDGHPGNGYVHLKREVELQRVALLPSAEPAALLAADPQLCRAWSYLEGPGLLEALIPVALTDDVPEGQRLARLHARLHVAGNAIWDRALAAQLLESIDELDLLAAELSSGSARPHLLDPICRLLEEQRGAVDLRRTLAAELLHVVDRHDRAVLTQATERRTRQALYALGFRPTEGRFGSGIEAWVEGLLPPE